MREPDFFARHDWVWLPETWRDLLCEPLREDDARAVADWTSRQRPLVVARRGAEEAPGLLRLGLALPGKRRIGLLFPASRVTRRAAPLGYLDAAAVVSAIFPEAGAELALLVKRHALDCRVFGSMAWQALADDPAYAYVTLHSDIDLLLQPDSMAQLESWIALLQAFERAFPAPRLDGEIALPDGAFMSWREYAARPKKLLVKSDASVALRAFDEIQSLFRARAA